MRRLPPAICPKDTISFSRLYNKDAISHRQNKSLYKGKRVKNLKLSHKLITAFLGLGILPALLITWLFLHKSNEALEEKAYELLISARDNKQAQVEYYFNNIRKQIATFSSNSMLVDATKGFKTAYKNYLQESQVEPGDLASMRKSVRTYYSQNFLTEYRSANNGATVNVDRLLNDVDDTGIALQYAYISNNSNPLGSKDQLLRAPGDGTYHTLHEKYHPSIHHFLEAFEYYDIFILDADTGNIIYSVFKELDFATSLKSGPYSNTKFAQAFNVARRAHDPHSTFLVDYEQYTPSYEAPASFISSPIYDGNNLIGVLIFQMPIERLNKITGNRAGLGETGEVYMVGADNLMRSDSYIDPENRSVVASFRNPDTGAVDNPATAAALKHQTGEAIFEDYGNMQVIAAYTPVDLGDGIEWALLAKISAGEAFARIPEIRNSALASMTLLAVIIIGIALWFARSITAPLKRVFKGLHTFSINELNQLGDTFKRIGSDISHATDNISSMSNHISESSTNQAASLEETSASMEEIASVTQQNSEHAQKSSQLSAAAQSSVEAGNTAMREMSEVMRKIKTSSEEIAGILKIIDDISFQTNILALNAAVEAARAGESGAGFAVVADEVRQLAQRTANASKDTAKLIQESVGNAQNGVKAGDHLTEILQTIQDSVAQAAELAKGVSSASLEQTDGISQINEALTEMDSATQRNAAESQELAAQSVQLTQVVDNLDAILGIDHANSRSHSAPRPHTPNSAPVSEPPQQDGSWQAHNNDDFDRHADFTFGKEEQQGNWQNLHSN